MTSTCRALYAAGGADSLCGGLYRKCCQQKNMLIQECEKYIRENFEKSITVADISRSIGRSPSYLSRIFKEATGSTIIHAISRKKIDKAKEYLLLTDMKIYEIADALGLENTTYFLLFF